MQIHNLNDPPSLFRSAAHIGVWRQSRGLLGSLMISGVMLYAFFLLLPEVVFTLAHAKLATLLFTGLLAMLYVRSILEHRRAIASHVKLLGDGGVPSHLIVNCTPDAETISINPLPSGESIKT